MADESAPPEWYLKEQARLFRYIEEPLGRLCPRLQAHERHLLARTIFSATHGIVSLGLDEKLVSLPHPMLEAQVENVVRAIARALPDSMSHNVGGTVVAESDCEGRCPVRS